MHIPALILFIYLASAAAHLLLFSLLGHFYNKKPVPSGSRRKMFAILIPAYKEDSVIVSTAAAVLEQHYPRDQFRILVIADSLKPDTMARLKRLPIDVFSVNFLNSTKVKALQAATALLESDVDGVVLLDADNHMEPDFLSKASNALLPGRCIIQCHRTSGNSDTPTAILDSLSEEINNHIFRKGRVAVGLSSSLIGSGIIFDRCTFLDYITKLKAVGGFDKELELMLLRKKIYIDYIDSMVVFDEKTRLPRIFKKQRTRWLSAQWIYLRKSWASALPELLGNRNLNYFDKVLQMAFPPRILLAGITFLVSLPASIFNLMPGSGYWIALTAAVSLSILIAVPVHMFNTGLIRALLDLPGHFLHMSTALLNMRNADKTFIHTPHSNSQQSGDWS